MVKLNWLETWAIYILVAIITIFFVRFGQTLIGYNSFSWGVWGIIYLIIYLGISGIVVKAIKGKDEEKHEQNKFFEKWWKKQKTYEKIILIIIFFIIASIIWAYLFDYIFKYGIS